MEERLLLIKLLNNKQLKTKILFCSTSQHNVLNWQRHAARRMILHYLEVDTFYQVEREIFNFACYYFFAEFWFCVRVI